MTFFLTLLLSLANTFSPPRLERTAPFDHPLNMVGSSWVVLDAEVGTQGKIQSIDLLYGASPFRDIALSNMHQWVFTPARNPLPTDSRVTVIFLFRPPDLFAGPPLRLQQTFRRAYQSAFPLELSDPGYHMMSVGEGVVVLELQVAKTGGLENVRVVSDAPGLAAHTESALRAWAFEPAIRNGSPATGTVIVVASYLRPILYTTPTPVSPYFPYPGSPAPAQPPAGAVFRDKPAGTAVPPPF